jgi:hypothetical protein
LTWRTRCPAVDRRAEFVGMGEIRAQLRTLEPQVQHRAPDPEA